ncbi:hypothetical protein Csa_005600 [Cucumis sativus]|uniref:Uncharacterized protein n=1 Tax=Cucumis sativus TaxID=3659 RepID=A0A0A0KC33_CUCSA|nr:hypothetical protein Csa_005600 [Cucumis sativus]
MTLEDFDYGIEVMSAGFLFFFSKLCDKTSLESLALKDFAFFDSEVSSLSCVLHFSGVLSSSSSSLTSSSFTSSTSLQPSLVLRRFDYALFV